MVWDGKGLRSFKVEGDCSKPSRFQALQLMNHNNEKFVPQSGLKGLKGSFLKIICKKCDEKA